MGKVPGVAQDELSIGELEGILFLVSGTMVTKQFRNILASGMSYGY